MVETHLIETFVEVVRQGTVTRAAKALDRSQPAVSHRLKQLEQSLGATLFEKVGRQLRLTEAGERLFDEAVDILERLSALRTAVSPAELTGGTVSVGCPRSLGAALLARTLGRLLDETDVTPLILEGEAAELRNDVASGALDVAIILGSVDSSGVTLAALEDVGLVAVQSSEASGEFAEQGLTGQRYLHWRSPVVALRSIVDGWAYEERLIDPNTPTFDGLDLLLDLVAANQGFTVVPDFVAARDVRLKALELEGLSTRIPLSLVTRSGWRPGPTGSEAFGLLIETLGG